MTKIPVQNGKTFRYTANVWEFLRNLVFLVLFIKFRKSSWKSANENACRKASLLEYRMENIVTLYSLIIINGITGKGLWNLFCSRKHTHSSLVILPAPIHVQDIKYIFNNTNLVQQFDVHVLNYLWRTLLIKVPYHCLASNRIVWVMDVLVLRTYTPVYIRINTIEVKNHTRSVWFKSQIVQYRAEVKCIK